MTEHNNEIGKICLNGIISGEKYGRLIAVRNIDNPGRKKPNWIFQCECGNYCAARSSDVKSGRKKSCGCLHTDNALKSLRYAHISSTKHGKSRTALYNVWCGMKGRCYTKSNTCYKRYGAKGITVCDEWLNDPQAFMEWAIATGYKKGLSIDRIDGTKGYSPDNCRWATVAEQLRNISSNVLITAKGKTQILEDWVKETGISRDAITYRLKHGMLPEEALGLC